jgi:hypothetical protein
MTSVMRAAVIAAIAPLALAACHDRKKDAPEDRLIAPGIYSSVAANGAGQLSGQELRLAQGSASTTLTYTVCVENDCAPARTYAVQRGRGGISFAVAAGDQPGGAAAVIALTPVPDGLMLTALSDGNDEPAESVLLRPRAQPLGLTAAGPAASGAAAAPATAARR